MKLKKILLLLITIGSFLLNVSPVFATDSASISGYGYTVNGYICDSYISGSATGSASSSITVTIQNPIYVNTAGRLVLVSDKSGTGYISYYGSSFGSAFYKWYTCYVNGKSSSSGGSVTTRLLEN